MISLAICLVVLLIGAVAGEGADARERLARAYRRDRPAAFLEDAVAIAIAGAVVVVAVLA